MRRKNALTCLPRNWETAAVAVTLIFVIGFSPLEHAFQGIEMPLRRTWAVIKPRAAKFAPGLVDDGGRKLLERLAGPHCLDLHLRGALEIIQPVIGVGDARPPCGDAV